MPRLSSARSMQPRTVLEIIDSAFWLYRGQFIVYIRLVALLFIFLSPFLLLLLGSYADEPLNVPFEILVLGVITVAGTNPVSITLREIIFPDGTLIWFTAAVALAPITAYVAGMRSEKPPEFYALKQGNVWVLILLVSFLVILLRMCGLGVFADIVRLPVLFAPHVLVLEQTSFSSAVYRSWRLVWANAPRVMLVFVLTLGLVRFAMFVPFTLPVMLQYLPPTVAFLNPKTIRGWIPITVLLAEFLIYPLIQVSLTLLYYDVCLRQERRVVTVEDDLAV